MSDKIANILEQGIGVAFDAITNAFARDNAVCYLIKRDEHSKEFAVVKQMTDKFLIDYGDGGLREDIYFFATNQDELFADQFAQTTHIGYGVPSELNEIFVYVINGGQKDKSQPDGFSPEWKCFASRIPRERFLVI